MQGEQPTGHSLWMAIVKGMVIGFKPLWLQGLDTSSNGGMTIKNRIVGERLPSCVELM